MDPLVFTKLLFSAATHLSAGAHDWPIMATSGPSSPAITEIHTADPWIGGSGVFVPLVPGRLRQLFCLDRGVYTIEARLGMLPTYRGSVDGHISLAEFETPGEPANTSVIMEFSAEARTPTFQSGSIGVRVGAWRCYSIRYYSTAAARVNPDPRLTGFSIRR